MKRIVNHQSTKHYRRALRQSSTKAEVLLWGELRNRKLMDKKFKRQVGIGRYIVDFYCKEYQLVIEVDGGYHFDPHVQEADEIREDYLIGLGLTILRFENEEVLNTLDTVLERIKDFIATSKKSPPLLQGEAG